MIHIIKLIKTVSLLTIISLTLLSTVQAAPILDQHNEPTGGSHSTIGWRYAEAQTFTVGITGYLTKVDVMIRTLYAFDDLFFEIREVDSGLPIGDSLASKVIPLESVPACWGGTCGVWEYMSIDLSPYGIFVNEGDHLSIIFDVEHYTESQYCWRLTSNYNYTGGKTYIRQEGSTWEEVLNGEYDTVFRTYVDPNPPPQHINIDIKPGSDPNCFNINGHGVIPVAILGSADLDVMDIKTDDTLSFNGLNVRVRGKKGPLCSIEDSNGDEFLDLVCHFEDEPSEWLEGSNEISTITGELVDGTPIEGTDSICIVP